MASRGNSAVKEARTYLLPSNLSSTRARSSNTELVNDWHGAASPMLPLASPPCPALSLSSFAPFVAKRVDAAVDECRGDPK